MSIPYIYNLSLAKSIRSVSGKQAAKISLYVDFVRSFGGLYFLYPWSLWKNLHTTRATKTGAGGNIVLSAFYWPTWAIKLLK